jgi:hypothetical protein
MSASFILFYEISGAHPSCGACRVAGSSPNRNLKITGFVDTMISNVFLRSTKVSH